MRDIVLARRQLLQASLFTVGTLSIIVFLLVPQFQQFQRHQDAPARLYELIPSAMPQMMLAEASPDLWQHTVESRLRALAEKHHVQIIGVSLDADKARPAFAGQTLIRRAPLLVQLQGAYLPLQGFLHALQTSFSPVVFQSVAFQNPSSVTAPSPKKPTRPLPPPSPMLKATFQVDLIYRVAR